MNKTLKKRTGLFDDQILELEDFWTNHDLDYPSSFTYKSHVFIKTKKTLLKGEFTTKTLALCNSTLYILGKKKNKVYKSIDLVNNPCKLYDYSMEKTKYAHKLVLRHHSLSAEIFFEGKQAMDTWISHLRNHCLMCDFTSMYNMGNLIVHNSLGKIYWVQSKQTGKSYAAKIYNIQEESQDKEDDIQSKIEKQVIVNEIKALGSMDHENILKLKEVHEFKDRVVMVTELITGSTLLRHIVSQGFLPELETVHIMKTLLEALQALHDKKILHRNLKPENVLLNRTNTGTEIKITAFNFSCSFDSNEPTSWQISKNICSKCGTPGYMAPELLMNKSSTTAGDVFSMGVILYTCLTGEPMFKGKSAEDIVIRNLKVNFDRASKWNSLSDNARDLINKMVEQDPTLRPSIDEILGHPFFTSPSFQGSPKNKQTTRSKFTSQSTGVSSSRRKSRKNSIEEDISQTDRNLNIDKALQSLIVSPTYFDLTKGDMYEVPEFYVEPTEIYDDEEEEEEESLNSTNREGTHNNTKANKLGVGLGIKIEVIRGSIQQVDPGTPSFKIRYPQGGVADNGESLAVSDDEEEEIDQELDESVLNDDRVLNRFRSLQKAPSPSVSQKPMVAKYKTVCFNSNDNLLADSLMTNRKLPEVHRDIRKKLASKETMLSGLLTKRWNQAYGVKEEVEEDN